ncbi:lipocalin family protein [Pseudomonas sp. 10B1]|uniref:lipocalin family protein n=1 Tax=unclassified Pseudomonas TaxID=196821 RepID=UPI002AB5DC69|nr:MULTISPECIES: lipocalin family protein [unclassified Pseudomonas]MDY7562939.1 lipocalin family protein [Pseudomonas sp. AB6]MEA9978636.1 lipocalin family protein [Pseudomonas sp. RTS4]MEA9995474.1 lipocalin family protein [Pseudomonas sp. AA4]MEB0085318.1 lipocalin family protein [Pseudomonas sp. RTI1]MEB0125421.1 lipocalin family protein [Pseudomonas sp. CCC1.2]
MRLWVGLMASLFLAGCTHSSSDLIEPKTVDHVDLKRYQGTWYELARLPMFFQRNCAQSQALYVLKEDGNIGVTNRCRKLDGTWEQATGTASPQVAGKTDKLWVVFDNWFSRLFPSLAKGDYWVLYVDDGYKTALVGNPDRKYLWLLSRTSKVSEATKQDLLARARQQGYDTTKLIWRVDDSMIIKPDKL